MTSNDLTPEDIVERLERALAALAGTEPVTIDPDGTIAEAGPVARGGAATGLLLSSLLGLFVELGAADVPTAQHTLMVALDMHASDARTGIAELLLNIVESWMHTRAMHEDVTSEQALSAIDHLGEAREHMQGAKEPHYAAVGDLDDLHDTFTNLDDILADDGEDGLDVPPPAAGALERLTDAAAALGILADIHTATAGGLEHPGFPVALAAGLVTGRVTVEMVNACRDVPEEGRGAVPGMWVEGFRYGVTVDPAGPPPDDLVAGVMLRIANLIAAWHLSEERNNTRSDAIGHLLTAAAEAGRADGLAGASVDQLAEFIAHRGSDHTDAHTAALASAEAGLEALQKVDTL